MHDAIRMATIQSLTSHLQAPSSEIEKAMLSITDTAVECAAQSVDAAELEASLKRLIDLSHVLKAGISTLESGIDTEDAVTAFTKSMDGAKREHAMKSGMEKYGHVAEFLDYGRRTWKERHPNRRVPPVETWFREKDAAGGQGAEEGSDQDDDMVVRRDANLKCPLTLQLMNEPVVSLVCVHAYERLAIQELMQSNGGHVKCPVLGCNSSLTPKQLQPNQRLREMCRKEHRRLREQSPGRKAQRAFHRVE